MKCSNLQAGYVGEDVESILYKLLAVCEVFCWFMMFEQIINSLFSRNEPVYELWRFIRAILDLGDVDMHVY